MTERLEVTVEAESYYEANGKIYAALNAEAERRGLTLLHGADIYKDPMYGLWHGRQFAQ